MQEKIYVQRSRINGSGLFTAVALKKGETVGYIDGPVHVFRRITDRISQRMVNWIGVGRYSWINTDHSPFRFINHSCEPNVAHVAKRKVIALRDIPPKTELTMDYSLTEAEEGWSIRCSCGSPSCRKVIEPIYKLPKRVFQRYQAVIPENFQKIYEVETRRQV